jgi:hypothetical protein
MIQTDGADACNKARVPRLLCRLIEIPQIRWHEADNLGHAFNGALRAAPVTTLLAQVVYGATLGGFVQLHPLHILMAT